MAYAEGMAKDTGKSPWRTISPKDNPRQWEAWSAYFLTVYGKLPVVWNEVEAGRVDSFTVPADDPVNFDLDYMPPSSLLSRPKRQLLARFLDGQHVQRVREWLARRTGASIEKINQATEYQRVSRGFEELNKELAAAAKANSLSMKNPHPLPKDRIKQEAGE